MTAPITPALTPAEWTTTTGSEAWGGSDMLNGVALIEAGIIQRWASGAITCNNEYEIKRPHAAAALCLYGQPFGFTREDVELLRRAAIGLQQLLADTPLLLDGATTRTAVTAIAHSNAEIRDRLERYTSLADRIAALLPPADDGSARIAPPRPLT